MSIDNNNRICPRCGASVEDFRRTGYLGCVDCYTVFRAEILPAVRRIQGKTTHGGKTPAAEAGAKSSLFIERKLLRENIERALREGRYAEAEEMQERLRSVNLALNPREDA